MLGFLDLPFEIRYIIYGLCLKQPDSILHIHRTHKVRRTALRMKNIEKWPTNLRGSLPQDLNLCPQLLATNKFICLEASAILYNFNIFTFIWSPGFYDRTMTRLAPRISLYPGSIQHAHIHIDGMCEKPTKSLYDLVQSMVDDHVRLQSFALSLHVSGYRPTMGPMLAMLVHQIKAKRNELLLVTGTRPWNGVTWGYQKILGVQRKQGGEGMGGVWF
ncbi:uncharacterized protein KY384_007508 [Bacidia gigantensis]|uniref:uncharacterized protein n=1 Tax=Bacidia gigantensis TaxID=2732470 RepID=UPI001D0510B5|nr:uncharacterized protein KY384_007508 [Bacidia gigantensis]KAG8527356.1 hypothetical protein KY384_007508 [Bacidia gigantensis]